jgi:hypothetical protein
MCKTLEYISPMCDSSDRAYVCDIVLSIDLYLHDGNKETDAVHAVTDQEGGSGQPE